MLTAITPQPPGARVDRPAGLADLEIQLRTRAAAAVARRGNGIPGRHVLTDRLEELVVVAVEAQVPVAVIDDREQPQARQPVGVDHPARTGVPRSVATSTPSQRTPPARASP